MCTISKTSGFFLKFSADAKNNKLLGLGKVAHLERTGGKQGKIHFNSLKNSEVYTVGPLCDGVHCF